MTKYILSFGCKEWQDELKFNSIEDAERYAENGNNMILGLYPASYAYIEDEKSNVIKAVFQYDERDNWDD